MLLNIIYEFSEFRNTLSILTRGKKTSEKKIFFENSPCNLENNLLIYQLCL